MASKEKIMKDWIKFFDADEVQLQLMLSSFYLTAYELLINFIISTPKNFFISSFTPSEKDRKEYKEHVRKLYPKDMVIASALWFQKTNSISPDDVEQIKRFKNERNKIAHELPKYIMDSEYSIQTEHFQEIRDIYYKIRLAWFKGFEFTINPEFDGIDPDTLNYDEVLMFGMLPMDYLVNIVNHHLENKEDTGK